ncbi:hypothetical protein [Microbacterium deminutum]|uniref:hypothetical protein n=1 Tax=Microbacterium deminutum TaxID=344164 RepID=UPI0031DD43DC
MHKRVLAAILLAMLTITGCSPEAGAEASGEPTSLSSTSGDSNSTPSSESNPGPTQESALPTTDLTCEQAIAAAAAVAPDAVNNDEVFESLVACSTAAEWIAGIQGSPAVFGVTSIPDADLPIYLQTVCYDQYLQSPVCMDAKAQGLL